MPHPGAVLESMPTMLDRITFDPNVLAGRATLRGLRISAAHIVNLVANGMSSEDILAEFPDLDREDIRQALRYAAMAAEDQVFPLPASAA
ncbi:MAG: hypothetical protein H6R09_995 [Proteobacteria bacterium]|nr:hypothetical protein [Pseudomonadota bacterium]